MLMTLSGGHAHQGHPKGEMASNQNLNTDPSHTWPLPSSSSCHLGIVTTRSISPRFVNAVVRLPLNQYKAFPVSIESEPPLDALIMAWALVKLST